MLIINGKVLSTHNSGWGVYLELVSLSTDTAGQARLLYQLLHLLQQWGLGHHLTLLVSLKRSKHINPRLKKQQHWAEHRHKWTNYNKEQEEYRHAQCSQGLLSHGHSHTLLLSSGLPAGCFNLQVNIAVLPQRLQKVLRQRADAFVAGYLLQLVQVGYWICAYQHLDRRLEDIQLC